MRGLILWAVIVMALLGLLLLMTGCTNPEMRTLQLQSPATYGLVLQRGGLGIEDVAALVQAGLDDDQIIRLIVRARSSYVLSAGAIAYLRACGVSEKVIEFMDRTGDRFREGLHILPIPKPTPPPGRVI